MLSKRLVTSLLARNGGISQVTKVRNGIQLARCCSTQGAQQTLKVKQKIEEKREAALLGGWLFFVKRIKFDLILKKDLLNNQPADLIR